MKLENVKSKMKTVKEKLQGPPAESGFVRANGFITLPTIDPTKSLVERELDKVTRGVYAEANAKIYDNDWDTAHEENRILDEYEKKMFIERRKALNEEDNDECIKLSRNLERDGLAEDPEYRQIFEKAAKRKEEIEQNLAKRLDELENECLDKLAALDQRWNDNLNDIKDRWVSEEQEKRLARQYAEWDREATESQTQQSVQQTAEAPAQTPIESQPGRWSRFKSSVSDWWNAVAERRKERARKRAEARAIKEQAKLAKAAEEAKKRDEAKKAAQEKAAEEAAAKAAKKAEAQKAATEIVAAQPVSPTAQPVTEEKPKRRWIELNLFSAVPPVIKKVVTRWTVATALFALVLGYAGDQARKHYNHYLNLKEQIEQKLVRPRIVSEEEANRIRGKYLTEQAMKVAAEQAAAGAVVGQEQKAELPKQQMGAEPLAESATMQMKLPETKYEAGVTKINVRHFPNDTVKITKTFPDGSQEVVWEYKDGTKKTIKIPAPTKTGTVAPTKQERKDEEQKTQQADMAEEAQKAEFKKALEAVTDSRVRTIIERYEEGTATPGKDVWKGRDGACVKMDMYDANELMKSIRKAWGGTHLPGSKKGIMIVKSGRTIYVLVGEPKPQTKAEREHAKMMKARTGSVAAFSASTPSVKTQ